MHADLGFKAADSGHGFALVGRRGELKLLSAGLSRLPAVVLVEGEAGVGKSRLVHESARAVAARGVRVLTGYCHPLREPLPFGPVLDALATAADWLPEPGLLNPQTGALAPLLPQLADRLPPAPQAPADPRAGRFQLLGAVRGILEALGPVVLVVEDLHWADETTRELLLVLARNPPKNLGLVFTYRTEDLAHSTPVLGAPYHRPAGTSGAEIHLDALSEQDVQDLVTAVMGPRSTRALGQAIYERSAGLPLVAEEDLLTLTDWGRQPRPPNADATTVVETLQDIEVPRALREAIVSRMTGLSAPAVAMVEAAAVLAVPSSGRLLADIADLDADQAEAALVEALQAAVLRESAPALYGFRHALAQQAVYREILGPLRSALHRRAHRVLQGQSSPPLVQIAHHTLALGDMQTWLREAEEAADQAVARGDDGTAISLIHDILRQPHLPPDLRNRAALALARIAHYSVDYSASAAALRRIVVDPQLAAEARGEIRLALGLFMINQCGDHAGHRELQLAVPELADRPDLAVRAMVALARGEPDLSRREAMAWMDQAERTAQGVSSPKSRAAVWATRLDLMALDGDPRVWELVEQLSRHTGDREVLRQNLRAVHNVGVAGMERGYDERAAGLLRECRDVSRQSGFSTMEAFSRIGLLTMDWLAGRWAGLEDEFAALTADAPDMLPITKAAAQIGGNLAAARGQWTRALGAFGRAAVMEDRFSEAGEVLSATAGIAQVRLAQGDPQAAWATVAPRLDPMPTAPRPWANGLLVVGVRAALACGDHERARHLIVSAEESILNKGSPAITAVVHLLKGMLLQQAGDIDGAGEHFDRAHVTYKAIGRPYPAAQAAECLAHTRAPTTEHDAAQQLAETANAYNDLGATADAARCEQAARKLGLTRPAPRAPRRYDTDLSPREQQVARLLTDGATNQDVAHALSLSVRTVEHHVARVLKKLDISREELRGAASALPPEGP
ncbi:AAA family ATPase [Streptomyces sp. SID13666]|uniref:ATP-binding protein n=1 Tax=unclassified Streptomyces TaxID=2593676 RepID=UPI0013C128DD|nr:MULTISPECIES: LuxR family transcriptional regulator [unclassified Streptomyces]NEA56555.1 AAA family ATPase [Streptomyces sp. SID13666]NEA72349.1 AAA family ATPase [Streptomyces sp. SID13588]